MHKKKIIKEIKKLKPVKLSKQKIENKKEENGKVNGNQKEEIPEEKKQENFHDSILEESIGFAAPVINEEEKNNNENKNETLEETAKDLPIETRPENQNLRPYASTTSNYMNNTIEGDLSSKYKTNSTFTSTLTDRDSRLDPFGNFSSQNSWETPNNRADDFQKLQDQYRNDRQETTGLPFQQKRKRHDIF
jgi:hypothetical protein